MICVCEKNAWSHVGDVLPSESGSSVFEFRPVGCPRGRAVAMTAVHVVPNCAAYYVVGKSIWMAGRGQNVGTGGTHKN